MRLARLVAAGLVLGVLVGFVSALLRPRSVPSADLGDTVDTSTGLQNPAVDGPTSAHRRTTGPPPAGKEVVTPVHTPSGDVAEPALASAPGPS